MTTNADTKDVCELDNIEHDAISAIAEKESMMRAARVTHTPSSRRGQTWGRVMLPRRVMCIRMFALPVQRVQGSREAYFRSANSGVR